MTYAGFSNIRQERLSQFSFIILTRHFMYIWYILIMCISGLEVIFHTVHLSSLRTGALCASLTLLNVSLASHHTPAGLHGKGVYGRIKYRQEILKLSLIHLCGFCSFFKTSVGFLEGTYFYYVVLFVCF